MTHQGGGLWVTRNTVLFHSVPSTGSHKIPVCRTFTKDNEVGCRGWNAVSRCFRVELVFPPTVSTEEPMGPFPLPYHLCVVTETKERDQTNFHSTTDTRIVNLSLGPKGRTIDY